MPRRYVDTKERVAGLLAEGRNHTQIARSLGITKSTVAYHARTLGRAADPRFNRRYDWAEVQEYYDRGHSITECQQRFGFARETWNAARRRGVIADGLKQPRCERCGIDDWLGEPLTLALHHLNGDNRDDRLENLSLLCPNCHSQTENFAGRNRRGREIEAEVRAA